MSQAGTLEIREVSLVYGSSSGPIHALDRCSFSLAKGEFVSLLGPSGCGKSTLLKLICGLMQPTAGTIVLHGTPVQGPGPNTGIVFQKPNLMPWKSVLENVLVPAHALRLNAVAHRKKAEALLELVGLAGFGDNYPWELSGGMAQRVGLARGLLHDPSLLLMDEPFAALDSMTREHMSIELQRIWLATQKSVVFVTHSIQEAVFLSDRVLVFSGRPGRVIEDVRVELPRPRTLETMQDASFAEYCALFRNRFTTRRHGTP